MKSPSELFCETITTKATAEGWTLQLTIPQGFVWKKGEEVKGEGWLGLGAKNMLHQACMFLEADQKWQIEIETTTPEASPEPV